MKSYEIPLAIRGSLEESKAKETIEDLKKLVTATEGEVLGVEEWGKKSFAYPIRKERSGFYYLFNFQADPKKIASLDKKLKLTDNLLRYLIIQKEVVSTKPTKKKAEKKTEKQAKEA